MPDQQKTTAQTLVLLYAGKGGACILRATRVTVWGIGARYHRRNGKLFEPVI
jgi:hypothetical protein